MKKLEILSPAGGMESVVAAINCGADAVYLGTKELNARRSAANFERDELIEAVKLCHLNGVKVYVTLNTLLLEDEISIAKAAIKLCCEASVDAVIVDDMGMVRLIKEMAPSLRLHASTQMSVHNIEGVQYLKEHGFSRVVLARELSLTEITEIAKNTDIELEVFVHGALCMCISGQCYLSAMIGQRSGNRGLCAQPCRLKFSYDGKQEHALSLKDLSLIRHIDALREAGVTSLKIEGRMKRPEYVAAAVKACRNAADGHPDKEIEEKLANIFSRSGFTDGYLTGKLGQEMFGIRRKEDVLNMPGVLKDLERLAKTKTPRIGVRFKFSLKEGRKASLTATDQDGNTAKAVGDLPEKAINKPTDEALVQKSLQKTGGTVFYPEEIRCDIDDGLMLRVSQLNILRREVLEELEEKRRFQKPHPFIEKDVLLSEPVKQQAFQWRARFDRARQLSELALERMGLISLPLCEMHRLLSTEKGSREIDRLSGMDRAAFVERFQDKLAVELPRAMLGDNRPAREQLKELAQIGIRHVILHNIGHLKLIEDLPFTKHGGFSLNITNSVALDAYQKAGLSDATLSFELSMPQIEKITKTLPVGILCYGHLPMMLTRNCPIKNAIGCQKCGRRFLPLKDRMGNPFPVACENGVSELYNYLPLYIAEQKERFAFFSFATLYFTKEDRARCDEIIRMHLTHQKIDVPATKGLYYRGVL